MYRRVICLHYCQQCLTRLTRDKTPWYYMQKTYEDVSLRYF